MRYLGLISLLITIAIAAIWLTNANSKTVTNEEGEQEFLYKGALDSAKDAAKSMER